MKLLSRVLHFYLSKLRASGVIDAGLFVAGNMSRSENNSSFDREIIPTADVVSENCESGNKQAAGI